ncbi:hypothetical protein NE237_030775 [Protea cynaroides]|uniref:Uncharacterized protein n=1 Tax=Protea cynaroides TaxID=273540 RepID=A0A9Q0JXM0_9MAGN|nr:hypothetical protein NE237_030775 [Protea cynaroides]
MGAVKTLTLQGLSDNDCWLLFKKWAFSDENYSAHPNLVEIGRKIVKKCNGLPLALKSLGGLLRDKLEEKEWELILKSDIWDLEGDDILPALSLSYHNLPAHLKLCFVYSSLFPKGYSFRKDAFHPNKLKEWKTWPTSTLMICCIDLSFKRKILLNHPKRHL